MAFDIQFDACTIAHQIHHGYRFVTFVDFIYNF